MAHTKDFAEFIRLKLERNPDLAEAVEKERVNADIALKLYAARRAAGMTQKQLAVKAGTHQSVICRLEDADYDGHSLSLLGRIARALGGKLRLEIETNTFRSKPTKKPRTTRQRSTRVRSVANSRHR